MLENMVGECSKTAFTRCLWKIQKILYFTIHLHRSTDFFHSGNAYSAEVKKNLEKQTKYLVVIFWRPKKTFFKFQHAPHQNFMKGISRIQQSKGMPPPPTRLAGIKILIVVVNLIFKSLKSQLSLSFCFKKSTTDSEHGAAKHASPWHDVRNMTFVEGRGLAPSIDGSWPRAS